MNKFCGIPPGTPPEEQSYLKKLGFDKKKEGELWDKFCLNCLPGERRIEPPKKFCAHPKRLCSNTDASVVSPRRPLVSSKSSNVNVDLKDINYVFQQNKMKIQDARKKLHASLTRTRKSDSYHLDLGIGDCHSVTPRDHDFSDKIVTYYDRDCTLGEDETNMCRKKSTSQVPDKNILRSLPSSNRSARKTPPLQKTHTNVISASVFEKKFKMFVEKSLHTINDIRSLLDEGVNPPDGEEDEARRIIRVKEFSNRFSRNYLYPLARQLEELTQMQADNPGLNQKLLSAYQVILNGLQAYHSHFPSSIGSCSSDRFKCLLTHLLQLCDIHSRFIKHPEDGVDIEFINTFRLNAELTLKKFEDHFSAKSPDSIKSNAAPKADLKPVNSKSRKNSIETRLSMYNISAVSCRKDPHWKKMLQLWAKKRVNVKSRYKTATYRHRPPIERSAPQPLPIKCKLFAKKSSSTLRRTPLTTPVNEDNISTMIQAEDRKQDNHEPTVDHEGVVVRLLRLVLDNNRIRGREEAAGAAGERPAKAGGDEGAAAKVADILGRLEADGDVEVLRKVLEAAAQSGEREDKEKEGRQQLKLQVVDVQGSATVEGATRRRKEPIITVTGEKNAKLICITDENSVIETEDDSSKLEDKDSGTEKQIPPKPVCSTETQTTVTSHKRDKGTQKANKSSSLKMKRLPKSSKCLRKLPKDYAVSIIQYKLDFHKHSKQNPMYRKTSNVQPWVLMAKISDGILDGALLGVAREIELNDIVQQVYDSELQL